MASTDKPTDPEYNKEAPPPPPPPSATVKCFALDITLRVLLFAGALTAVVVMVTSNQTEFIAPLGFRKAKFRHSPAFVYFVAALSVAGLYSIITTLLASLSVIWKPHLSTKLLLHFAFWDVLILGLVASATGTAGGVAYVGLKGNDHVMWNKICNKYDKFCHHVAGSLAASFFASIVLVLLVWLSVYSLHGRIPK